MFVSMIILSMANNHAITTNHAAIYDLLEL